jgi:hypothetical protein
MNTRSLSRLSEVVSLVLAKDALKGCENRFPGTRSGGCRHYSALAFWVEIGDCGVRTFVLSAHLVSEVPAIAMLRARNRCM